MAIHLSDEPTLQLDANSERLKILISLGADIVQCESPCVFAVHGDWGAGKTSFLRRLYLEISTQRPPGVTAAAELKFREEWESSPVLRPYRDRTELVWFEAWKYQAEPVPVVALLHEIRRQMLDRLRPTERLMDNMKRLLWLGRHAAGQMMEKAALRIGWDSPKLSTSASAGAAGGASFNATAGGPKAEFSLSGPSLRAASEAHDTEHFGAELTTDRLRGYLSEAVEMLLHHETVPDRRLVIFIDDLDRCDAEAAFRLLEGIRVYLNLPNCVFVFGLNQREVERAIAKFLPVPVRESSEEDVILIRSQEYIEKLCGSIVRLPRLPVVDQDKMLEKLLVCPGHEKRVSALRKLLQKCEYLPANPRRIKAWCGVVHRLLSLRDARLQEIEKERKQARERGGEFAYSPSEENDARALAVVASLYQFHPQLYALLEAQPSFFEQLVIWSGVRPERRDDGRWPPGTHAILRRFRFPESWSAAGRASHFEDAMSVGVVHCAPLLVKENFKEAPTLRLDDFRLYLAR